MRTILLAPLLMMLTVLLTACEDDEPEAEMRQIFEVHVRENGLEPRSVTVRIPDTATLQVVNNTDAPCSFHFGPWVRDLQVQPGGTARMDFTTTEINRDETSMLCEGRSGIVGTIEVRASTSPP